MRDNTKTTREPPSQEKWPCSQDLTALEARKQKKQLREARAKAKAAARARHTQAAQERVRFFGHSSPYDLLR